jgi:hypothetical protein
MEIERLIWLVLVVLAFFGGVLTVTVFAINDPRGSE